MDWNSINRVLSIVIVIEALAIPVVAMPFEALLAYGIVLLVIALTHIGIEAWEAR